MPKNVLQDVMPPQKKSIRNIPLHINNNKNKTVNQSGSLSNFSGPIEGIKPAKRGGKTSKIIWWLILILILIGGVSVFSMFFSGAKIVLIPKQEVVDFNTSLVGVRKNIDSRKKGVPYSILKISNEGFRTTLNVTEKEVDKKASGEITIFNSYNTLSQRLVKNTRFETSDGLIYRTPKSVIVPGKTKKDGKIIPGSITITVYADSPGEKYNINLADFTIPGFKGTDRFSKFYARSKTKMKGGFSGVMKIINDSELSQMRKEIQSDLTKELKEGIYSQIPEGSVLYDDGIYINFESKENVDLGDSVQVVEKGILTAIIFDKSELSNYIAENVINLSGKDGVEIINIDELKFSIENKKFIEPWKDESFEFSLSGLTNFVWIFDEDKMKENFAGQSKKDTKSLLSDYEGIKEAEVVMTPFWKMNFPKDINKIEIQRVLK